MTITRKYTILTIFCLFLLTMVGIWVNNSVLAYSEKFENMSKLSQSLTLENQIIENEVSKQESLAMIASKSAELGFLKSESIEYIR